MNGADAASLEDGSNSVPGYFSTVKSDYERPIVDTSTETVDTVVVLFIFIAGLMAGVVLLNLENMYVTRKKRELTIMRINGFTIREVIGYVARETVVTTVAGIIPGIAAGALFAIKIIGTLEQMMIRFVHKPDFVAFAAAGLTAVFTVIVNCIALRKVRYLKLTDV